MCFVVSSIKACEGHVHLAVGPLLHEFLYQCAAFLAGRKGTIQFDAGSDAETRN